MSRLAITCLSLIMMLAILLGGLLIVLSRGPLEVPFMSERIATALENQIGNGVDIDVGRSFLERAANGLELHIHDIIIKDGNSNIILRAPDALVTFDPLRLLKLTYSPRRIALQGITANMTITRDGGLSFSAAGENSSRENSAASSSQSNSARLTDGLAALALLAKQGTNGDLAEVSIQNAVLLVDDQRATKKLRFDRFSLNFESPQKGIAVASGSLSKEGNVIPFQFDVKTVAENYAFSVKTSNVSEELIATALGLAELPMAPTGKLSGSALVTTDSTGRILSAETRLNLIDGAVAIKGVGTSLFKIQEAHFQAQWNGSLTTIDKALLSIKGTDYSAAIQGFISLATAADPWIRFHGKGKDWTFSGLNPSDALILVKDADMRLSMRNDGQQIVVESMTMKGPETDINLSGNLSSSPNGKILNARAVLGAMPIRNAIRWWPTFLAPYTRQFFADTVKAGQLSRLDLAMSFPDWALAGEHHGRTLPASALKLEASVEGITAQIAAGLPPLVGLAGTGRMNLHQAEGTATAAFIELLSKKRIPLSEGAFSLTGLEGYQPKGVFRFRSQTPMEHIAELLKFPALKEGFSIGFDPDSIKGQFDGRGAITIPLSVALKPKDIVTEFNGNMTSVFIEKAIGKDRLENASLTVSSDATGLEIKGKGIWQNTPVNVELENDSKDKSSSAVLSFLLDDAGLKRLGVSLGQSLTRPLPVRIKTLREEGSGLNANVEADLTNAAFDGLLPGYRKALGRPGKLSFDASEKPGGYSLKNISLESGASSFKGNAEILNGAVTSAKFNLYRLSPGDNVRLDYDKTPSGQKVVIRGNNFDARPFLRSDSRAETERNAAKPAQDIAGELDIDLKTTLLTGFGGEVITNAEVRAVGRGEIFRQFNVDGRLNGKRILVTSKSGVASLSPPIQISSEDAGAFLRFIDVYSRMIGGQLEGQLTATNGNLNGVIQTNRFVLRNEPAIKRLIQGAPTQTNAGESLRTSDITEARFEKMRLDFQINGTKTTVRDAVIFGPEIGLTFNGLVDRGRDRVSLSGTFIPAYGLNNALAQIPVFGRILTGARNEGVLALTFGITGRASEPNVTINPLSAITPGIFRKIFEFRNETTGTNPSYPSSGGVNPNN